MSQRTDVPNTDGDMPFTQTELISKVIEFHHGEGYSGEALRAALMKYNRTLEPMADEAYIDALVSQYVEDEVEREEEDTSPEETAKRMIEQAIAEKDVKKLLACIPFLAALAPIDFEAYWKKPIKEAFGRDINMNMLISTIAQERRKLLRGQEEKPDIADIAYEWASQNRSRWAFDRNQQVFRYYEDEGTHWQEQSTNENIDKETIWALQDREVKVTSLGMVNLFQRVAKAACARDFLPVEHKINFANGTLDTRTMQLGRHSREDSFTYCLPYDYDYIRFSEHPNISHFLEETVPDAHGRQVIMIHAGLALMGDTSLHYVPILAGPPRSGKTTLLALINALCGVSDPWKFAGASLFARDLEGKRSRYIWAQSRIVCVDELPIEALRDEELFKSMTAHSGVEMRGIGKDEHTDNRWRPKLLLATNETPHYKDTTGAIKERAIFVECPHTRQREKRNPQLFRQKLLPELGAFARTCIELAKQALDRGYYPMSVTMKRLLDQVAVEGNPLKAFIEERCFVDAAGTPPNARSIMSTQELHERYCEYCKSGHHVPLARNSFASALHAMNIGVFPKRERYGPESKVQRCLIGIRLLTEDEMGEDEFEAMHHYQADILLPCSQSVDSSREVVDSVLTVENAIVDAMDPLHKGSDDSRLTVLTVENEKETNRDDSLPLQAQQGESPIEESYCEKSSTSSTRVKLQLVEPFQSVDNSLLSRQQTQRLSATLPKWLQIGHPEWKKLVARVGEKEAMDRRERGLQQAQQMYQ